MWESEHWTCEVTQEQKACCIEGCTARRKGGLRRCGTPDSLSWVSGAHVGGRGTNPCRLSSELHMFTAMCASMHTYICMNKNLKNVKPLALGMVADIPAQEAESEDRVGGRLS